MLKQIIKKILPKIIVNNLVKIKNNYFDGYATKSYSQEGEDMILQRIFERQSIGFYVDVGAHHPKRFSNTFLFYKKGWNGINIDAMPGSMKVFNRIRSRDINLEIPVSDKNETLTYYMFNEPALNGFSKELTEQRNGLSEYKVISEVEIKTFTLEEIRKLKSLIAIELKIGKFKPEYAGKMNFYLSALNDTVKLPDESPSIGIIICKEKKRTTVEYALKDSNQPIGVATYKLTENLPKNYQGLLPTVDEIEDNIIKLFGDK